MKLLFDKFYVKLIRNERKRLNVQFNFNEPISSIEFWAPAPPDYNASFSGSALPFPDSIIAYENSPNTGKFIPDSTQFTIDLMFPNSYYSHLGTRLVEPHLNIKVTQYGSQFVETIFLGEIAPFRLLTYPAKPKGRSGPEFYDRSHLKEARSQEAILRSGNYPSMYQNTPKNFWGKFIPHT